MKQILQIVVVAMILAAVHAQAQSGSAGATPESSSPNPAHPGPPPKGKWEFSGSAYGYVVPDGQDYVQLTVTADRDWLHLEGRYNYEALDTASVWVGWNLSGGGKVSWELTPMLGGVFGHVDGIAPGYKGELNWWKLQLYSEGEYMCDMGHSDDSFFYNWSELTIAPVEAFRFGLVTQRTRTYHTDHDIQRGLLLGFSLKKLDFTAYIFNPDDSTPLFVGSAIFHF